MNLRNPSAWVRAAGLAAGLAAVSGLVACDSGGADTKKADPAAKAVADKAAETKAAADKVAADAKAAAEPPASRRYNDGSGQAAPAPRTSRPRGDSLATTFGKSIVRQLGSSAGRELVRGVLGSLFRSR